MLAGGDCVPDPRECLPEDGPSEDSSPALWYMSDGGEMLAPSAGVYGRAGGEEGTKEGDEYVYSPMVVLRFKVLNPRGEPDGGTKNRTS